MTDLFSFAKPILHAFDAETAHGLTIKTLATGLIPPACMMQHETLKTTVFGRNFSNPIGLAAGFDKNAEVATAMLKQGFGFVEVGTITPRSQMGNPRPRLFRLPQDKAVINRMGFNNAGHSAAQIRLRNHTSLSGIIGVNIGANKDSPDRGSDYVKGLEAFHDLADYLTINISSPNTPGLRGLQSPTELTDLLNRLNDARARLGSTTPLVLKIAPDLIDDELNDIAHICLETSKAGGLDGIIISNTTIARPALAAREGNEAGGLSGAPLFKPATKMLAKMYHRTGTELPLIGVGGISSAEDAWQKIRAGASLIQLYTALVYQGPQLVSKISDGLNARCQKAGFETITQACGSGVTDWLSN